MKELKILFIGFSVFWAGTCTAGFAQIAEQGSLTAAFDFAEKALSVLEQYSAFKNTNLLQKIKPLTYDYAADLLGVLTASEKERIVGMAQDAQTAINQVEANPKSWIGALRNIISKNKNTLSQNTESPSTMISSIMEIFNNAAPAYSEAVNELTSKKAKATSIAKDFTSVFAQLNLDSSTKSKIQSITKKHFKKLKDIIPPNLNQANRQ